MRGLGSVAISFDTVQLSVGQGWELTSQVYVRIFDAVIACIPKDEWAVFDSVLYVVLKDLDSGIETVHGRWRRYPLFATPRHEVLIHQ
jgi:hypothetical protein